MPLRTLVAGAGLMGSWHARYAVRAGARIAAVVDPAPERANALGRRFPGAARYTDLESALHRERPEVVHVCTPSRTHATLVEVALEAGCHVLCEKPLAGSAAAAASLFARAARGGRLLAAVHQMPFQAGFARLVARRERLGELVRVAHEIHSAGGEGLDAPERRELLVDMLVHPVSLVTALGLAPPPESWSVVDAGESRLSLVAGGPGPQLEFFADLVGRPTRNELAVVGSRGSACADLFHGYAVFEAGPAGRRGKLLRPFTRGGSLLLRATANLAGRALRREPAYPGLRPLIARFYEAAAGRSACPVAESEVLAAAELGDRVRAAWPEGAAGGPTSD